MKIRTRKEVSLYYHSPIGIIELRGDDQGLRRCSFIRRKKEQDGRHNSLPPAAVPRSLQEARQQLDQYFKGQRRSFSVKLNLSGSPFQKRSGRS